MNGYMSICKCCKGAVAKGAKTCPHCGAKKPSRFQPITNQGETSPIAVVLCIVVVILVVIAYS